jgi:hypothetical protein
MAFIILASIDMDKKIKDLEQKELQAGEAV